MTDLKLVTLPMIRPLASLYSRYFTESEIESLQSVPVHDHASEINLLRVLASRFMELQQTAPKDMESQILALRTLCLLSEEMSRLAAVHCRANDPLDELGREILTALTEMNPYEDLGF